MTKSTAIPKRWRPRFSLRTLVLFVTLVSVYFGAWEATKTFGVPAVEAFIANERSELHNRYVGANSPLPFYVRVRGSRIVDNGLSPLIISSTYRCDHLWIFGWIIPLRDEKEGPKRVRFSNLKD